MSKTPVSTAFVILVCLAACPSVTFAAEPQTPTAVARGDLSKFPPAYGNANALDVHGALAEPQGAGGPWPLSAPAGEGGRLGPPLELGDVKSADLPLEALTSSMSPSALPLSQVAGGATKKSADSGPFGLWSLLSRVRDGGLPEPASWALILIGFGMIGGALRGFMVTNRRLAGLQPEDTDPSDLEDFE